MWAILSLVRNRKAQQQQIAGQRPEGRSSWQHPSIANQRQRYWSRLSEAQWKKPPGHDAKRLSFATAGFPRFCRYHQQHACDAKVPRHKEETRRGVSGGLPSVTWSGGLLSLRVGLVFPERLRQGLDAIYPGAFGRISGDALSSS
jgi:hypothetical protein